MFSRHVLYADTHYAGGSEFLCRNRKGAGRFEADRYGPENAVFHVSVVGHYFGHACAAYTAVTGGGAVHNNVDGR